MRKIIIILGGILIVGLIAVGLYFFWPTLSPPGGLFQNNATSATVPVEQGAISQTVMVNNAKLVAREEFDLSFPFPGRIKSLSTQEGLVVSDKSELVQLDPVELELERQKTQAAFKQSVSNFNKIKVGTSNFELKIFSNVVEGSKTTLANSKRILIDAIRASYATADDSVRDAADQMITNPRSATPQLTFSITDSDLKSEIESARKDLEESLADWEDGVNKLDPSDNLTKANRTAEKKLNATRKFLDDLAYAVNGITAGGGITQETLTAWQLYVATARASLATMKSDLSLAFSNYRGAGKGLAVTESQLGLKQVGNRLEDIEIAHFQMEEAESALDIMDEKLLQATLKAPRHDLVVKKIFPKEGERVQIGETVISLATANLKIQIDVSEEDMAGIALGKTVSVTLETFPDNPPATGTIEFIAPQEVLKNDNVYYRVYAKLDEQRLEWRTGMTGDATIDVGATFSALKVPRSAVYTNNGKKIVHLKSWSGSEEKEVTTGLSDQNFVEILSGLTATDEVVRYPNRLP